MDLKTKSKNVAVVIGVNPYFLKEYDVALKLPYEKVKSDSGFLRDIDVKAKGNKHMSNSDLLREMLYNIFN
jgi:DNA polymerase-3 subunit delta